MSPIGAKSPEDRYARELRRVKLAQQLLRHQVRRSWVQDWTGCSDRRIRAISRSMSSVGTERRRRGPQPSRGSRILSTSLLRSEASAIAGLAARFGLLPESPIRAAARTIPNLALGERLCWLYDVYREWLPDATLTMERFLLLVLELAERKTLMLSKCDTCGGFWVVDLFDPSHRQCNGCATPRRLVPKGVQVANSLEWSSEPVQHSLF